VPPLAERSEDIPLLAQKFLNDIAEEYGNTVKVIEPDAMEYLKSIAWTGNVRELRNVIERLIILCGEIINLSDVKIFARQM
jgi:DNA-binding NtrC family response regulator